MDSEKLLAVLLFGVVLLAGFAAAEADLIVSITDPSTAENNTWRNFSTVSFDLQILAASNGTGNADCMVQIDGTNDTSSRNQSVNTNESTTLTYSATEQSTAQEFDVTCNGTENNSGYFLKIDETAPTVSQISGSTRMDDRRSLFELDVSDNVDEDFVWFTITDKDSSTVGTSGDTTNTSVNSVSADFGVDVSDLKRSGSPYTLTVNANDSAENSVSATYELTVTDSGSGKGAPVVSAVETGMESSTGGGESFLSRKVDIAGRMVPVWLLGVAGLAVLFLWSRK